MRLLISSFFKLEESSRAIFYTIPYGNAAINLVKKFKDVKCLPLSFKTGFSIFFIKPMPCSSSEDNSESS
jgi:hypothetical protein